MKRNSENVTTIKDIATLCGVSISTVSNVLNGKMNKVSAEVAEKIHDIVKQTGYQPNYLAKNLRAQSTKTIGVIAEELNIFSTSPMIEGLMQCCEEKGYNVVIENMRLFGRWHGAWMHDDALYQSALTPIRNKMDSLKLDGIVYISSYEHVVNFKNDADDMPMVLLYATNNDGKTPSFRLDDEAGGYEVYKHLISMGHSKIAIITGEAENSHTVNRLRGVQRAMFEAGILYNPALVTYQTWDKEGGYKGARDILDKKPTALLCMSDLIAAGAYEYMHEHDIKPGIDISIVGYDNREISEMLSPPLTTLELPLEKMGYEAVDRLIKMIEEPDHSDYDIDIKVAGELLERKSVKRA